MALSGAKPLALVAVVLLMAATATAGLEALVGCPSRGQVVARAVDENSINSLLQTQSRRNNAYSASCIREAICATGPFGRLGNHLYILGTLLDHAAHENLCFVLTGGLADSTLGKVIQLPEAIDVATGRGLLIRELGNVSCTHMCKYVGDCGRWRHGHKFIVRREMQRFVKANEHMLRCNGSSHPALGPNGIVMHLRSGDIMRENAKSGYYPQPPCSFYIEAAEHGNINGSAFETVLLVTEPDLRNPCVEHVRLHAHTKVTVQTTTVTEDACMLVLAQNVAISMGTWGPALVSLNTQLRNLYVPFGLDQGTTYTAKFDSLDDGQWSREVLVERGIAQVAQHVYSFPGYNTTWDSWDDRVVKMTGYPGHKVLVRSIPTYGHRP